MPPHTSAIIQRAKRNVAGEDISRAVVSSKQCRPEINTTSKAIILRHGRHGIWGEGQIASFKKLSGQEKLALRAAELRKTAVSPLFRLSELLRTAEAEMGEALDSISDLHDPDFFYEDISNIIASRPRLKPDLLTAPFVAKTIAARAHNAYLLAASWKVVTNVLAGLKDRGLTDSDVRNLLKKSAAARDAYLLIIDTVEMLCNLAQQELSVAVVGSNELGGLFSGNRTSKGFSAVDPSSVMSAHRSLIDAVVIELVLPDSRYEPHILTAVLRDALDTTPREEAKKFSQNVFDALGNFVALVEMKNMLLGPLYGPEGSEWLKMPRKEAAGEIDEFFDAITRSLKASGLYSRWQSWAYPLRKTKSKAQLDDLWKQINTVYIDETGQSIDALWQLENERQPNPQWSTWYIPEFAAYAGDIPSEDESTPFSLPGARKKGKKKEKSALIRPKKRFRDPDGPRLRKAIMLEEDDNDEYEGMPGLMSVSESSEDDGPESESDSEEDEGEEEEEEEEESEWEGQEQRKMQALLSEAMRSYQTRVGKVPTWTEEVEGLGLNEKELPANLKSNPFMKMLRSFAGRVFNPDPTFRPSKMGEKPIYGPPRPPPATPPTPAPKAAGMATAASSTPQASTQSKGMTLEDADDEDEGNAEDKKKKKKKKKKPKKKTTVEENAVIKDALGAASPVQESTTPATSATPTPAPSTLANVKPPTSSVKSPGAPKSMDPYGHGASTISLPASIAPSVAQSAHSYLGGKEGEAKVKMKTRADPNTVQEPEVKKKGFFSRFIGKKYKKAEDEKEKDEESATGSTFGKRGAFQLPKRAGALVGRLLGSKDDEAKGKATMRWEHFVKAMNLLGFKENKGSQGSRVTFYPPDPKDKPMVIHKPHPDPTISPVLLKHIGKRLKDNYGWAPEHFESRLGADAAYFDDDLD